MTSKTDPTSTIRVAATCAAQAYERISGGAKEWTWTRSESEDYTHAGIAASICAALPGDWSAKPQSDEHKDCGFYLVRSDALTLWLSPPAYHHKDAWGIAFSRPSWKREQVGLWIKGERVANPSMNCSVKKSPEVMAKDIARRILPECERQFAECNAIIEAWKEQHRKRDAALDQVAAALGIEVRRDKYTNEPKLEGHAGNIEFRVSYDGSVTLKIDTQADKVAAIAAALN
jgi:hypothetical protein